MPYEETLYWEGLADLRDVSKVARSERGFLTEFKRVKGNYKRMSLRWRWKRHNFIKRHLAKAKKSGRPLYGKDGLPSRQHLAFIMWAYTPNLGRLIPVEYEIVEAA